MMRIHAVKDVNHALTGRFARGPETFVIVKVEDTSKGRTKATRTDKWTDELLNLEIDKANEIELTVYDKSGQFPTPIGMLWIRISDIVEEMRRNKMNSELAGSQWVTAEQMNSGGGPGPGGRGGAPGHLGGMGMDYPGAPIGGRGQMGGGAQAPPGGDHGDPNIVEAWFSLEPVGSIKLSMSFSMWPIPWRAKPLLTSTKPSKTGAKLPSIPAWAARGPSASGKKKCKNSTATSSSTSSSTASCAVRCVENSSRTRRACSAKTASTCVTRIALPKSSPSASASRTPRPTPTRRSSTTVSLTASIPLQILPRVGVAIVGICCRLARRMQGNAQVGLSFAYFKATG